MTPSTPSNTNKAPAIQETARPQGNAYTTSAATSSAALRSQTAMLGHNVFRPDVYRVSEGYLN